jgi:hypothetical protein
MATRKECKTGFFLITVFNFGGVEAKRPNQIVRNGSPIWKMTNTVNDIRKRITSTAR